MGYKSKFKGAEIDARLEYGPFFAISKDLRDRIYNLEGVTVDEVNQMWRSQFSHAGILFPGDYNEEFSNVVEIYRVSYVVITDDVIEELIISTDYLSYKNGEFTYNTYGYRFIVDGETVTIEEVY